MIDAGQPLGAAAGRRGQADLLRRGLDVVEEEGARLVGRRGVPVVELVAVERLIAGDGGQGRPGQVLVQAQADALALVVAERLGVGRGADQLGEIGADAPAGDAVRRVDRIDPAAACGEGAGDQAQAPAVRLVAAVVQVQVDVGLGRRGPVDAQAGGLGVLVAQAFAGVAVVLPGAARFRRHRQARRQVLSDGPRQIALQLGRVIAAVAQVQAGGDMVGRGVGDHADGAAGGVAAVKRALRPAQHLDAGDVVQQTLRHHAVRIGHLVDIDAHGRGVVGGVVGQADAANAELGLAAAQLAVDLQAGHRVLQVVDRLDVAVVQRLARDDGQGQADLLRRFGAALGRDDDVVDRCGRSLGLDLGDGGQGRQGERGDRGAEKKTFHFDHPSGDARGPALACRCVSGCRRTAA